METRKRKVIAIVGPTASGKTRIAVQLAKDINGEIISADSRQVYRGLNIGTGKDLDEYNGVRYHLIDIVDPEEKMTLFDYLPLARAAIEDIFKRGKTPIIVGGTGLYVQGIVEGFKLEQSGVESRKSGEKHQALNREQLNDGAIKQLNSILLKISPENYEKVDHKNRHRLIRAIELAQEGLKPTKSKPDFEVLQLGIEVPRKELHERIDRRVDERFKQGMLEEVIGLLRSGVNADWLLGLGLEYKIITEYLTELRIKNYELWGEKLQKKHDFKFIIHDSEFQAMAQRLKFKIHQFARRQLTWFRRFPEIQRLSKYDDIKRFVNIFIEH